MEQNELVEEPVVVESPFESEQIQETPVDKNWRQAQQVMAEQKNEIDELKSMIFQLAQSTQAQNVQQEEPDEFDDERDDDYVTVAKAKRIIERTRKTAEKEAVDAAQKVVNQHLHNQNLSITEDRARQKYDDYDYVIENYTVPLIKNDPALAHRVNSSKNPAETAYRLGRVSDDYVDRHETKSTSPRAEKILKNSQRPGSSHTAQSLKTQANTVSSMSHAEIWKMSQQFASSG